MWNFFRKQNPEVKSAPTKSVGIELIKEFTTDDEPKVLDFPRGQYTAYWEIVVGEVPGGYTAQVRFYAFDSGTILESNQFTEPEVKLMKSKVNNFILNTIKKYKR